MGKSKPFHKPLRQAALQKPHAPRARRLPLLYGCFFASGVAGLMLEVVWSKYLSLLLGNSIYGVSTVVAAFLGGLGLGAAAGGRLAARVKEPLFAYARLELIVAALGVLSPAAYLVARPISAALNALFIAHGGFFLFLRFLALFIALLVPTTAMGATLPLVVSDVSRRDPRGASSAVARLYAVNTAGAVLGVAAAGFLAIPAWGLWRSAAVAASIDLGVVVAILRWRPAAPPVAHEAVAAKESEKRPVSAETGAAGARAAGSTFARLILPAFALSGFTAILYEVAWTRLLAVPFGGMVYAFSAILAIYLTGIALGAAAAARLLKRFSVPVTLFGTLQILLAAAAALATHLFTSVPHWQAHAIAQSMGSTRRLLLGEAGIAARIILPATFLLGALFPTAVAIAQRRRHEAGESVGSVYAANTLGSIAGSLLTAFLLIPWIGTLRAILSAAALNVAIGIVALWFGEGRPAFRRGLALAAILGSVAFAVFAMPVWNAERMSLGFIRLLRSHWFGGESQVHQIIDRIGNPGSPERMLFYKEGQIAAVTVIEAGPRRALLINGKTDATTGVGEDMAQQVLVGQLPLLFTQGRDVCVVGYGSGVTTHAVLTHPVRRVLTVELEGAVIDAAPYFEADAGKPLADPRSGLLVEDAGTYLRSTKERYDVIISEPSNLWIAGMADLFTKDFYHTAASKLRSGGIFCQWVQCYQTSAAALRTIFRTLATRFPHGQIFFIDRSADLIILASPDRDVPLDLDRLDEAMRSPDIAKNLARVGVGSLPDLLRYYRGRLDSRAAAAGPGTINTDDNAWLEHRAPFDLLSGEESEKELAWSPQVAADLASSITSDRGRAAAWLDQAIERARAAGQEDAANGLRMARERLPAP